MVSPSSTHAPSVRFGGLGMARSGLVVVLAWRERRRQQRVIVVRPSVSSGCWISTQWPGCGLTVSRPRSAGQLLAFEPGKQAAKDLDGRTWSAPASVPFERDANAGDDCKRNEDEEHHSRDADENAFH